MQEQSPKTTGISEITGKIITIRHANKWDMAFIREELKKYNLEAGRLYFSQFVVAVENGKIIGFGRLKKIGGAYEIGCVTVVEGRRRRGIGSSIIKHLIDYAPVKSVYAETGLKNYFGELGFIETKDAPRELLNRLGRMCKEKGKRDTVLMVHKKPDK